MQDGLLTRDDERVARIVATLKSGYRFSLVRNQIDDFAFALVAPLGANYNYVFSHTNLPNNVKHDESNSGNRQACKTKTVIIHLSDSHNRLPKQIGSSEGNQSLNDQIN